MAEKKGNKNGGKFSWGAGDVTITKPKATPKTNKSGKKSK